MRKGALSPFMIMFLVMVVGIVVAGLWQTVPIIKTTIHAILDPTAGALFSWHPTLGMVIFTAIIALLTTILQKYATDQEKIKALREEQKLLQQEMKLLKDNPEKQLQLSQKSMELMMQSMPLTMKPTLFTAVPFILFFRWFSEYFILNPVKILGMSWFWAYLIFTIIWSTIFRKLLKVH